MNQECNLWDLTLTEVGQRLDKAIAQHIAPLPRSLVTEAIKQGRCRTKSGEVLTKPSFKLIQALDIVIDLPQGKEGPTYGEDFFKELQGAPFKALQLKSGFSLDILYEDEYIAVINKPAGLVTHPGAGQESLSLMHLWAHYVGESLMGVGQEGRWGIVHRLDKETSGVMILVKTQEAYYAFRQLFESHTIERSYYALCWRLQRGALEGEIEGYIARHPSQWKKMKFYPGTPPLKQGKWSKSTYYIQELWASELVCGVECRLETGRTHQVRTHLESIGLPLVGDRLYGRDQNKQPRGILQNPQYQEAYDAMLLFPRQALHAFYLGFTHPFTQESLTFETDMPEDMSVLMDLFDRCSS